MRLFGASAIVCKPMACQAGMHRRPAFQAGIAQLVEHDLAKVGVASSNLVSRSIIVECYLAGWQSGHAAACKAVYAGSIPALAC